MLELITFKITLLNTKVSFLGNGLRNKKILWQSFCRKWQNPLTIFTQNSDRINHFPFISIPSKQQTFLKWVTPMTPDTSPPSGNPYPLPHLSRCAQNTSPTFHCNWMKGIGTYKGQRIKEIWIHLYNYFEYFVEDFKSRWPLQTPFNNLE